MPFAAIKALVALDLIALHDLVPVEDPGYLFEIFSIVHTQLYDHQLIKLLNVGTFVEFNKDQAAQKDT